MYLSLSAVLPCLAYDDEERKVVREKSIAFNTAQMNLVKKENEGDKNKLDLPAVMDVLTKQLHRGTVPSKVAALRWIYHLFIQIPVEMFKYIDDIFPVLLNKLSDTSDEVVILDLEVLAEISSSKTGHDDSNNTSPHFKQFMQSLLKLFCADRVLLETKGNFIIRQLCVLLSSEDIYRSFSELLVLEENLKFARTMVRGRDTQVMTSDPCLQTCTLSTILLTSSELWELRTKLKELTSAESCQLFCCLYQTWCHSQVIRHDNYGLDTHLTHL